MIALSFIRDLSFSGLIWQGHKDKERNSRGNSENLEIWPGAQEFLTPDTRNLKPNALLSLLCELSELCG